MQGTGRFCVTNLQVWQAWNERDDCPTCLLNQLGRSQWYLSPDGRDFHRDGSAEAFLNGQPTKWWGELLI